MEFGRRSSSVFTLIHLVGASIAHPSRTTLRMTTSKWIDVTMKTISRKKVMNIVFQHTHEAASRPLIVKRINAKIMIVEMTIETWFVRGLAIRTPGAKTTSMSTLNLLIVDVTAPAHRLQVAIHERQDPKATAMTKPSHPHPDLMSCSNA
jgi:hypothetical protein